MNWFPEFVQKYLTFTPKCARHCDKTATMRVLSQDPSSIIGAYVCPEAFVSRVVAFNLTPGTESFQQFLVTQVGKENLRPRDIRTATRHGWELGGEAHAVLKTELGETGVVYEAYWTRYPRTDEEKLRAVWLCTGDASKVGCLSLFMNDRTSTEKFCPKCRASN